MTAYVISDSQLLDADAYDSYRKIAGPSVEKYGGTYVARRGEVEVLEGEWQPGGVVMLKFPSMEKARAWYHSPEYAEAMGHKAKAMKRNLVVVEGLSE